MGNAIRWTAAQLDDWAKRRLERHGKKRDGLTLKTPNYPPGVEQAINDHVAKNIVRKYGNTPTDGEASKRQAKRLHELRLMNEAGQIRGLARQVEYVLLPKQMGATGEIAERRVTYIADFAYERWTSEGWKLTVEDTKGFRTPDYILKRKMMLAIHGIEIIEI